MTELSEERELIRIANLAGDRVLEYFRRLRDSDRSIKGGNARDLVTVADKASEEVILAEVSKSFPGVSVLSEEAGQIGEGSDKLVVDPLDGTTNFSQGLQHFGVSIALLRGGETRVGVVGTPALKEVFSATKGAGARLNGSPIRVSVRSKPEELFVAVGFACIRAGYKKKNSLINFEKLAWMVREQRRLGSASVDLAYTACGIFDAFYELSLSQWDVAAGILLVEEAGGKVTDLDGGLNYKTGASLLASNGLSHDFLIGALPVHWGE